MSGQQKFNLKAKFKKLKKPGKPKFHKIKTWQLILILIPLLFVDATLLRMDHLKMADLRTAVIEADANEDDEAIAESLEELKNFTLSHIVINVVDDNGSQRVTFGTGPFYLEHTYRRAANRVHDEAEQMLASDANPYGNIYLEASQVCQPIAIANGWQWDTPEFKDCMLGEIQKYPASRELTDMMEADLPSTELYRKEFASPIWAPTLTGFMILITLILIVVIFIRGIIWVILRLSLLFM